MGKRFSETDKWQDEWFSALEPYEKLTWLFICDKCDAAGFFEINARVNSFLIGITIADYLKAIEGLEKGIVRSEDGKKGFIKKFLHHQKNFPLNPENKAHKPIYELLKQNVKCFKFDFKEYYGGFKGDITPLGIGIGNGIGNGKGKTPEILENFEHWIKNNPEQVKTLKTKTNKTEKQIIASAYDYHLYLIQKGEYPKAAEMLLAGFERRLVNNWGAVTEKETQTDFNAGDLYKQLLSKPKQAEA